MNAVRTVSSGLHSSHRSTCQCASFLRARAILTAHSVWDLFVIGALYQTAAYLDAAITSHAIHPLLSPLARFSLWALYGFCSGLFGMGLWVLGHECGHQSFSESKTFNNTVGWILHSSLGVPYHAWRITHSQHHASTGHMTRDQAFVPCTRSEMSLKPLDPLKEDRLGSRVSEEIKKELMEAIGDSPVGAALASAKYLVCDASLCRESLIQALGSSWGGLPIS